MSDCCCCGLVWDFPTTPSSTTTHTTSNLSTTSKRVPMVRREINLTVQQNGVEANEKFYFLNTENEDITTRFRFPSQKCRIFGLKYKVDDGDWTIMRVEEAHKAEQTHKTAIQAGHQSVLAKNISGNIFSVEIGRLQSYEMAVIQLSYLTEMDWVGHFQHRHQLTMFPPYVPTGVSLEKYQEKLPKFSESSELPYGVFMTILFQDNNPFTADVMADTPSTGLTSDKDHQITYPRTKLDGNRDVTVKMYPTDMSTSVYSFQKGDTMYYQLNMSHRLDNIGMAELVRQKDEESRKLNKVLSEYDVVDTEELTTEPTNETTTETTTTSQNTVFIVDGSGSMGGSRIDNARQATKLAIKQLPNGSQYAVLVFGSNSGWGRLNSFYPATFQQKVTHKVSEGPYHYNISCDGCRMYPIKGDRYYRKEADMSYCQTCYFNHVGFKPEDKDRFTKMDPPEQETPPTDTNSSQWITHNDDTYTTTMKWLDDNATSDYGGTEMFVAVESVYQQISGDNNTIILITDAGIYTEEATKIKSYVQNSDVSATIFGLGIGTGNDTFFLDSLTTENNGIARHIDNSEDIKENVQRLMRCAVNGRYLRHVNFTYPKYMETSSRKPIDVYFFGEPLTFYLKTDVSNITGEETVVLNCGDIPVLKVNLAKAKPSRFDLEQVFGLTQLEQMLKYPKHYRKTSKADETDTTKITSEEYTKTVVELAKQYNVITDFTSAVLVVELPNPKGGVDLKKVDVPIGMASDFGSPDTEITSGFLGINTVGQTFRNANYQLRSTPASGFRSAGFQSGKHSKSYGRKKKSAPPTDLFQYAVMSGAFRSSEERCNSSGNTGFNLSPPTEYTEKYDDDFGNFGNDFGGSFGDFGGLSTMTRQDECERSVPSNSSSFFNSAVNAVSNLFSSSNDTKSGDNNGDESASYEDMGGHSVPATTTPVTATPKTTSSPDTTNTTASTSTVDVESLIDTLILNQKTADGSWEFNQGLCFQMVSEVSKYRSILAAILPKVEDDLLMTLIVLSYFEKHPEFYNTYRDSQLKGQEYLRNTMMDSEINIVTYRISMDMA